MREDVSCLINIQENLNMLTDSEARVAQYVLDHSTEVLQYSVSELAEHAGVSVATVVRFSKSAGYKGYKDLKIHLAQGSIASYKHLNTELEREDTAEQIAEKIIRSEISTLEDTLRILDMEVLEKAAQVIRKARRVVFFGTGGSGAVAYDAMHKFLKIGIQSVVYQDADVQAMESALLHPLDAAFAISHSGTNRNVIECLKNAKQCGATVIGMTTEGNSPFQKVCDYVLTTATRETIFKSESVTARLAQLSIIDILVAIMTCMDYDGAYDAIQKTRSATSGNKY